MIRVNDRDEIAWERGMTVTRLLEKCHFTSPKIAVFVNGELVRRPEYDRWLIEDGAQVRVLHLIGGG